MYGFLFVHFCRASVLAQLLHFFSAMCKCIPCKALITMGYTKGTKKEMTWEPLSTWPQGMEFRSL